MSSIIPNKEWMKAARHTVEYVKGIQAFVHFVKENSPGVDWHSCPCSKCRNMNGKTTLINILDDLICNGIDQSYTTWIFHGETFNNRNTNRKDQDSFATHEHVDELPRMVDLVNDAFRHISQKDLDACMNAINTLDPDGDVQNSYNEAQHDPGMAHSNSFEEMRYEKLKEDATQPIFSSCREEHSKLSVIVELLSLKTSGNWSDNSFTDLLRFLKNLLPEGNAMPDSIYSAKMLINSLGMKYEIIHACPNDCILYRKEHEKKHSCPMCGASRWKSEYLAKKKKKYVPAKVLRYFPLIPRLKRLYR